VFGRSLSAETEADAAARTINKTIRRVIAAIFER